MECEKELAELIAAVSTNKRDWTDTLTALILPGIAIIGAIIAFMQAHTNRMRLKHELFDRRYEIYNAAASFLADIAREGTCSNQRGFQYLRETAGAEFIFDEDIKGYLDMVYKESVYLHLHTQTKDWDKEAESLIRLSAELTNASEVFAKYLKLDDRSLFTRFLAELRKRVSHNKPSDTKPA